MSDRVSVLQIKLSNSLKYICNFWKLSSQFKNSVSLKVQQNRHHANAFQFGEFESIPNSKHLISIFNVYATSSQLARDDVSILENFYDDVSFVSN